MTQPSRTKTIRQRITVTKADIGAGQRRDCACCPVALAAERAFGRACLVGNEILTVARATHADARLQFWLSGPVLERIDKYDVLGEMTPFSFVVSGGHILYDPI